MRSCVVLTWNREREVRGVRTEKNGRNDLPAVVAVAGPFREGELGQRLHSAYAQLVTDEPDCILLGGMLPGELLFDLAMPKIIESAIPSALAYELPCVLPQNPENYRQSFRVVNRGAADAKENHLRLWLAPEPEWDRLIGEIDAAQLKVDAVLHPWLAVDPLLADRDLWLSDWEDEYAFCRQERKELRQMVPCGDDPMPDGVNPEELISNRTETALEAAWLPAILLARYAHDSYFAADRKTLFRLPGSCQPQRCVRWRQLAVALGIITFILLLLLAGRNWHDARTRYTQITEAEAKVGMLLVKQQRIVQKNLVIEKAIQKIAETKSGNAEIPALLLHLTKKLPDKMWITSFRCKDQAVDLTISAGEDNDNILTLLSENGICVAKNLRKQRNPDGTSVLQLFLELPGSGIDVPESGVRKL